MAGSSVGLMVFGPLTQLFVQIYGWRGTMLLLGGVVSHIVVLGALLRPPSPPPGGDYLLSSEGEKDNCEKDDFTKEEEKEKSKVEEKGYLKACCCSLIRTTDCLLLKDPMFIIIIFVSTTIRFTQMAWLIYLVPNVVSKGIPLLQASFISTTAGVGDFIGRLIPGIFANLTCHQVPSLTVWTLGMSLTTMSLMLNAIVESYVGMMILGCFQGLGLGMMYSSTNVVLFDEFGKERLVNSMGWARGISGIGRIVGGVLPGR